MLPHESTQLFPKIQGASYLNRYDILCQRLVQEQFYTTACLMASPCGAAATGDYAVFSDMADLAAFVTAPAGHVAAEAARTQA